MCCITDLIETRHRVLGRDLREEVFDRGVFANRNRVEVRHRRATNVFAEDEAERLDQVEACADECARASDPAGVIRVLGGDENDMHARVDR